MTGQHANRTGGDCPTEAGSKCKPAFVVLAIVLGLLAALLAGEISLRVADRYTHLMARYTLHGTFDIYTAHPFLNHTLAPNLDYEAGPRTGVDVPPYRLRTNAMGFRVQASRSKPPGVYRIAVLGDSLVQGEQEEFTLPYLLAQQLPLHTGEDRTFEALNFGIASYSPVIHYVNLGTNVLEYQPDLVVMHVDMTDVFDDSERYRPLTIMDPHGNPEAVAPRMAFRVNVDGQAVSIVELGKRISRTRPFYSPRRIRLWLLDHSRLFRLVTFRTRSVEHLLGLYYSELDKLYPGVSFAPPRSTSDIHRWCWDYDNDQVQEQIAFMLDMMARIQGLLDARGVPLVITTCPHRAQLRGSADAPEWSQQPIERLRSFCRERGIAFCVPLDEFEDALQRGESLYFADRMHPNYRGQQIWAEVLARCIAAGLPANAIQ